MVKAAEESCRRWYKQLIVALFPKSSYPKLLIYVLENR